MATKIKLMRLGKIRSPHYRIVVADSRTRRSGRVIETLGRYVPVQEPSLMEVNSERVQYWLGVGAQPTDPVMAILKVTGDWQKFKNLPAPPPMKVAEPKTDRRAAYLAATQQAQNEAALKPATTQAGGGKKKQKPDKAANQAKATEGAAETGKNEAPATTSDASPTEGTQAPAASAEKSSEQ